MPSLWKSGPGRGRKSIRGTISAPIPIANDVDDDEFPIRNPGSAKAMVSPDDEFPMRQPGTGIASPLPPAEPEPADPPLERQAQPQPQPDAETSTSMEEPPAGEKRDQELSEPSPPTDSSVGAGPAEAGRADPTPEVPPEASAISPPGPPPGSGGSNDRPASRVSPQRTSPQRGSPPRTAPLRARTSSLARAAHPPLSMARYSLVSESPSAQTGQSKDVPQRKKSTLRSALGRLFGRGRKKNGSGSQDLGTPSGRESGLLGSSQHRSDPTALGRSREKSPKRSTSLPLTEYDRPLRSHSIGPHDIMAIESARNSLQAEATGSAAGAGSRRRAATTTSRMLFQPRIRGEWGAGLSPRPASTHGRSNSRLEVPGDVEDPNEIGRAITSDSDNGARRRSRSLSGLQDLAVAQSGTRRRSDEIRFWRESYDPGFMSPLLSSNPQDDNDIDDTGIMEMSAPESPVAERPPKTPPQPFNFGNIPNTMIGMKITQVASVDIRVTKLEGRTKKLERVVNQLCHIVPGFKTPLQDAIIPRDEAASFVDEQPGSSYTTAPPVLHPSVSKPHSLDPRDTPRYASSHRSTETADSHSQISFGDAPTFIGSLHPPSSSAAQSQSLTATAPLTNPLYRPNSNSTVRGTTSLPTLGRDPSSNGSSNDDQYATLVAQLEAERAARQALEAQVKKLSERVNTLSTTMFAMVRAPPEARSHERLTPGGGNSPLLQAPKTLAVPLPNKTLKSLSSFEAEGEKEVSRRKREKTDIDDESITEDFQTPREERPPLSYGAFGEELRPDDDDDDVETDDPKRKKAARTLSLSQLTLGKGQRTQI
ncbi:hypothetical protein OQA88_1632 [Cercophora sp. LCS_1]